MVMHFLAQLVYHAVSLANLNFTDLCNFCIAHLFQKLTVLLLGYLGILYVSVKWRMLILPHY